MTGNSGDRSQRGKEMHHVGPRKAPKGKNSGRVTLSVLNFKASSGTCADFVENRLEGVVRVRQDGEIGRWQGPGWG